ncbi:hypothetical protein IWW40_003197 [Coemansia sp. RSA 1250]|nr:hypothetical protein IWW40_003197 [Coemansia sp. RSA 1250]
MNSQLTAYDGTGTATAMAATNDSGNGQALAIGGAFSNMPEDYEGYDNARARKRRMTVSGERRTDEINFSDANCNGILGMLDQQSQQQQQHSYDSSAGSSATHGDLGSLLPGPALSSLPIPPGSEGPSTFNAALAGGMSFGGMNIQHSACLPHGNSISDSDTNFASSHNPLSPPTTGRAGARKHQSLSIAIGRDGHNEYNNGSQEPVTPGMFSPSFMDAMEGAAAAAAAAAGMSSPPMFYNVTSPYTPGNSSHHHSFSLPGAVAQGPQTDIFSPGSLVNTFGSEGLDHGASNPATSPAYTAASTQQQHGQVSMEDFSAGLNISMNAAAAAAMAAAMGGSYDGGDGRSTTTASAFSRVPQNNGDMSHLLYSGAGSSTGNGLGLDIATTLGPFGSIPGLEHFSGSGALSLQGSIDHGRFTSVAGPGLAISSPVVTASDAAAAAPATRIVKSPLAAGARRSRKRAATVANIRTDNHQTASMHDQRPPSSTALLPGSVETGSGGMISSIDESTGPAFNSQAVVRGSGSKVVMVLTSKVAQKSYGTEKRFLCPPPTVLLFGDSWGLPAGDSDVGSDAASGMPRISVTVPTNDNDAQVDAGDVRTTHLEWLAQPEPGSKPKAHVPHTAAPARAPREGEPVTGRFVAKQLFINDVDEKRKKVAVKVGLHDPTGRVQLGEFESRPIKVISKPSKKRQSVKNVDLCIHHGTTISLFNRLRSQTVSTKYLGATRSMSVGGPRPEWFPAGTDADSSSNGTTTFVARNAVWDPFIIWIVNTHLTQQDVDAFNARVAKNSTPVPGYPTPPTFALHPQCPPDLDGDDGQTGHAPIPILYNQPVILQCVSTGMCSPVLTLRKVEKGSIAVGAFYGRDSSRDVLGDPVSQLHKVAFELRVQSRDELPAVTVTPAGLNTRVGSYLTCMGDVVGLNATCDGRQLQADSASSPRKKDAASAGTTSWAEDVGDNAVWTMVGTDCAIYRFDYPPAADIAMRARQAAQPALALPPTPTSPRGSQDCLAQQTQQYSFDMLFGSGSGSCETSGGMDATLTAAVCGMSLPGLADGLAPHLLASASLSAATVAEPMSAHADGRAVPVVFKSQAQHPPTVSPRVLDGRHTAAPERACVTLHGINFTPDMVVQFGSQRSAYCEVRSDTCIVCLGPLPAEVAHSAREQPRAIPTSPSSSDLSNGEDARSFALHDSPLRTHRASSAESTASSATATHSLSAAAPAKSDSLKIPIYLSCNGGTGPTYKTGQFYSMHL